MSGTFLKVGQRNTAEYTQEQAHQTIERYCFETVPLRLRPHIPNVGEDLPDNAECCGWAYRTYDCVPAEAGPRISPTDIMVTTAINSRIGGATILALTAAAELLDDDIGAVEDHNFWDLSAEHLQHPPENDRPEWHLWRAWYVLMSVPGSDVAVTHKILHHKRPSFFPLLDRITLAAYPKQEAWTGIHLDLTSQSDRFEELEKWFAQRAASAGGRALSRLRLHDILLWSDRKSLRR